MLSRRWKSSKPKERWPAACCSAGWWSAPDAWASPSNHSASPPAFLSPITSYVQKAKKSKIMGGKKNWMTKCAYNLSKSWKFRNLLTRGNYFWQKDSKQGFLQNSHDYYIVCTLHNMSERFLVKNLFVCISTSPGLPHGCSLWLCKREPVGGLELVARWSLEIVKIAEN